MLRWGHTSIIPGMILPFAATERNTADRQISCATVKWRSKLNKTVMTKERAADGLTTGRVRLKTPFLWSRDQGSWTRRIVPVGNKEVFSIYEYLPRTLYSAYSANEWNDSSDFNRVPRLYSDTRNTATCQAWQLPKWLCQFNLFTVLLDHIHQVNARGHYLKTIRSSPRFKYWLPVTVILLTSKNWTSKVPINPQWETR